MKFTPLVGTLAYLWDQQTDRVLMIRRDARLDDDHFGKVNGLGGKIEPDESLVSSLQRELDEEAGVAATELSLRGTITFSDFGPKREQWLVFVFLVTAWSGDQLNASDEGSLEWVSRTQLLAACDGNASATAALPMWAGDRHFVPLVFDDDPRSFHGTMPYDADQPVSWSYERL